jgi:tetratricopeptide (TPR) repeat protein
VATFVSVFPHATMWLIGEGDVLLVASTTALDSRLADLEQAWQRPGVAADLRDVSATEPFAFLSLFVGGPQELTRYAAGAAIQTDDRMALEFSGPRALNHRTAGENASAIRELRDPRGGPPTIRRALSAAGAAEWRNRGAMMLKIESFATAYQDYLRALTLDPTDAATLEGLARPAIATHQEMEAIGRLKSLMVAHPRTPSIWVAASKLLAATGSSDEAMMLAREASNFAGSNSAALEQLASILADLGDVSELDAIVDRLEGLQPRPIAASYYAAAARFLHGQLQEGLRLAQHTIIVDPRNAAAHNLLGAIHATLGERDAARDAFQTALRLDPRDSATYTNLGQLELASASWSSAAGYFTEALSLDPRSAVALKGLSQARRGIPN